MRQRSVRSTPRQKSRQVKSCVELHRCERIFCHYREKWCRNTVFKWRPRKTFTIMKSRAFFLLCVLMTFINVTVLKLRPFDTHFNHRSAVTVERFGPSIRVHNAALLTKAGDRARPPRWKLLRKGWPCICGWSHPRVHSAHWPCDTLTNIEIFSWTMRVHSWDSSRLLPLRFYPRLCLLLGVIVEMKD